MSEEMYTDLSSIPSNGARTINGRKNDSELAIQQITTARKGQRLDNENNLLNMRNHKLHQFFSNK